MHSSRVFQVNYLMGLNKFLDNELHGSLSYIATIVYI